MKKLLLITALSVLCGWSAIATNVSGFISSNTTWNLAGSPYIVTGTVLLDSGYTLTIDPGVIIKFDSHKSLQISGVLRAIGSNANKIIFTSNAVSPAPGDWDFISFNTRAMDYDSALSTGNIMQYCIVEYAGGSINGAIQVIDAFPYFSDVKVRNNANTGIYSTYSSFDASHPNGTLKINSCTINNNTSSGNGAGINLYLGQFTSNTAIISNNTFVNNISNNIVSVNGGGAICIADALSNSTVNINNNFIYNNTSMNNGGGMNVFAYSGTSSPGLISNCYIHDNLIYYNHSASEGGGIYVQAHGLVSNNTIYSNDALAGGGITEIGITVSNNLIVKNSAVTYGGYHCAWFGDPLVKNHIIDNTSNDFMVSFANDIGTYNYNTITRNTTANGPNSTIVFMDGSNNCTGQTNCHNNNLYGNVAAYEFTNNRPSGCDINASNSWWGTTTATTIDSAIFDFFDNSAKSIVYYNPVHISPDTTAPVTPVVHVTKTDLGGGNIQLDWYASQETDLLGYKVYYGSPTGYSFSNSVNAGNVTSYILSGASITDTIAVSAYDTQMDGTSDMYEGHESWYTNAIGIPVINFTASTQTVCENDTIFYTDNTIDATMHYWSFPGGTPDTSNAQNPVVIYNTPGTHNVSLMVSNIAGMDTASYSNYITVNPHPNNDDCAGAQLLTVSTTLIPVAGSTDCATNSFPNGCAGAVGGDVWYTFTTSAAAQPYTITVAGSSGLDCGFQVFYNFCGGNLLNCTDASGVGGTETAVLSGLGTSTQYWIRVFDSNPVTSSSSSFTIGITAPPVNDDCVNAITLTPNSTCTPVPGDVTGATQTLPACAGNADDDVWYNFTATAPQATITVSGSASFDAVFDVSSSFCGNNTINCTNATGMGGTETTCITALTVGSTYWIRVYDFGAGIPTTTTFTICVFNCSAVGVEEVELSDDITISPNPTNGLFQVSGSKHEIQSLKVTNIVGEEIFQSIVNNQQSTIDLSTISKGIYFIQIIDDRRKTINRKIIIQ